MAQLQEQAEKGALFKGLLGAFQVPNFGGFRNGKAGSTFRLARLRRTCSIEATRTATLLRTYVRLNHVLEHLGPNLMHNVRNH